MTILALLVDAITTTAAVVAQEPPHGLAAINEWAPTGNAVALIGIIFTILTFWRNYSKERKEGDEKLERHIDEKVSKASAGYDVRIDRLEQTSKFFMSRAEIEKEISHSRAQASTAVGLSMESVKKNANDIVDLRIANGKVEQKYDGLEDDVSEIKTELREVRVEIKQGFKEVNDCLNAISKKV